MPEYVGLSDKTPRLMNELTKFKHEVMESARRDGYDVRLVSLVGPDKFEIEGPWRNSKEVVISDAFRKATFRTRTAS